MVRQCLVTPAISRYLIIRTHAPEVTGGSPWIATREAASRCQTTMEWQADEKDIRIV
jgi:hypothetical protein